MESNFPTQRMQLSNYSVGSLCCNASLIVDGAHLFPGADKLVGKVVHEVPEGFVWTYLRHGRTFGDTSDLAVILPLYRAPLAWEKNFFRLVKLFLSKLYFSSNKVSPTKIILLANGISLSVTVPADESLRRSYEVYLEQTGANFLLMGGLSAASTDVVFVQGDIPHPFDWVDMPPPTPFNTCGSE
jgi:hypothetical protein